jgi:hypothetical protein
MVYLQMLFVNNNDDTIFAESVHVMRKTSAISFFQDSQNLRVFCVLENNRHVRYIEKCIKSLLYFWYFSCLLITDLRKANV